MGKNVNHEDNRAGENLRKLLDKKGLQQKELAYSTGWSPVQINRVINGKNKISEKMLQDIIQYFDETRPEIESFPATEAVHWNDLSEEEREAVKAGKIHRHFDKDLYPGTEHDCYDVERGYFTKRFYLNPDYLRGLSDEMYLPESEVTAQEEDMEAIGSRLMVSICDVLRLNGYDITYHVMPYPFFSNPDFDSDIAQEAEHMPSAQASIRFRDKRVELTPSELYGLFWRFVRSMKTITRDMIYEKETAKHFR